VQLQIGRQDTHNLPKIIINTTMKACSKCKETKDSTEFNKSKSASDGLRSECRCCQSIYSKKYYPKNKGAVAARSKKWREENKDTVSAYHKQYRIENKQSLAAKAKIYNEENKEKIKETKHKYKGRRNSMRRKRYANDRNYRTITVMRTRMNKVLAGVSKSKPMLELLGCSLDHFHFHIEQQFTDGMTWDNRGDWHYDHIQPCSSFDQDDPKQQEICWHYTNYQPMWAEDNISKHAKIIPEHQVNLI